MKAPDLGIPTRVFLPEFWTVRSSITCTPPTSSYPPGLVAATPRRAYPLANDGGRRLSRAEVPPLHDLDGVVKDVNVGYPSLPSSTSTAIGARLVATSGVVRERSGDKAVRVAGFDQLDAQMAGSVAQQVLKVLIANRLPQGEADE